MQITLGKVLSLIIALAYVTIAIVSEISTRHCLTPAIFILCAVLLLPLALIWFPEELGSFTGYVGRGGRIDTETPPGLVSFMGWFFLVGMPVLGYILSSQ
ncbi:MAG: hypothetical protein ABFD16_20465 [Thermoguttaceae bacterium]|jgi:hypothetical protein